MALVKNGAALMINDLSAEDTLVSAALDLLNNKEQCEKLAEKLGKMALPEADEIIAGEVLKLVNK